MSQSTPENNSVLDEVQLKRINGVHRGFLYQHLVAVGALLLAGRSGLKTLRPERDEDVELVFDSKALYVQVKYRSNVLQPNDVESTLERFDQLREAHELGRRSGTPCFVIFTNAPLSPSLIEQAVVWRKDTHVIAPNATTLTNDVLPPPWASIQDALSWCISKCKELSFGTLSPETLVWKLAGLVQAASAGQNDIFHAEQFPELLELLVLQLQRFPPPPQVYWPHDDEPKFNEIKGTRIILGISGSGKTAWAASGSLHSGLPVAYFDVLDLPSASVAPTLVRELVATFFDRNHDDIRSLLLPGPSGLQSLIALDQLLRRDFRSPIVVIDNAHRVGVNDLRAIVQAAPNIRFVILAQPWPKQGELESRLSIQAEHLNGWRAETVGRVFADYGCLTDLPTAERLAHLTGGLPLFVSGAALLCQRFIGGDSRKLADLLEAGSLTHRTIQETISSEILGKLSPESLAAAVLLSACPIPLAVDQVLSTLSDSLGLNEHTSASSIKELVDWGILQHRESGAVDMHDAFRLSAASQKSELAEKSRAIFLKSLADKLKPTKHKPVTMSEFRFYCSLLPKIGELQTLADLASSDDEYFLEQGITADLEEGLLVACQDTAIPISDRFWALDSIAYWAISSGERSKAVEFISKMEHAAEQFHPSIAQRQALILKKILVAGLDRDLSTASGLLEEAKQLKPPPIYDRIIRYSYAYVLFQCGEFQKAEQITADLGMEYYDVVGLDPLEDVFAKNLPEIAAKLGDVRAKGPDLKHLADVLDLRARCLAALGSPPMFCWMHAHKFYVLAEAMISAVKVGQEVVDDLVSKRMFSDAKYFIEGMLLPSIRHYKILEYQVPITSQYAVVLAYCGQFAAARRTMDEIRNFAIASERWRPEFQNQEQLIEAIAAGNYIRSGEKVLPPRNKVGRNEPCPCGSGKKFKRCCGA